jgi:hypothetical protein
VPNLKPDTLTDLTFRSNFAYSANTDNIDALINVTNNKLGRVSAAAGDQLNKTDNSNYNHNLNITRRFRAKKGRTLNFYHYLNLTRSLQRYITESLNEFYYPAVFDREFNQLRRQEVPVFSVNTNVNFSEPLSKKLTLRFNNQYQFLNDRQNIGIFTKTSAAPNMIWWMLTRKEVLKGTSTG